MLQFCQSYTAKAAHAQCLCLSDVNTTSLARAYTHRQHLPSCHFTTRLHLFPSYPTDPQPSTFDPRPSTLDPRPSTLDPRPSTLDPRPSTLDPRPSTLDPRPSTLDLTLNTQQSILNTQPLRPLRLSERPRKPVFCQDPKLLFIPGPTTQSHDFTELRHHS
jgi:hypothetical protein